MNYLTENYRKSWVVSIVVLMTLATSVLLSLSFVPSFNELLGSLENSAAFSEEMLRAISEVYDVFTSPVFLIIVGVIGLAIKLIFFSAVLKFTLKRDQDENEPIFTDFKSILVTMLPAFYADGAGFFLKSLLYIFKIVSPLGLLFINIAVSIAFTYLIFYFFKVVDRNYRFTKNTLYGLLAVNLFFKLF